MKTDHSDECNLTEREKQKLEWLKQFWNKDKKPQALRHIPCSGNAGRKPVRTAGHSTGHWWPQMPSVAAGENQESSLELFVEQHHRHLQWKREGLLPLLDTILLAHNVTKSQP